jgi:hypothetical protein
VSGRADWSTCDRGHSMPACLELSLSLEHLRRLDDIFPGYKTAPEDYASSAVGYEWPLPGALSRCPAKCVTQTSRIAALTAGRESAARYCSNRRATWRFLLCLFA